MYGVSTTTEEKENLLQDHQILCYNDAGTEVVDCGDNTTCQIQICRNDDSIDQTEVCDGSYDYFTNDVAGKLAYCTDYYDGYDNQCPISSATCTNTSCYIQKCLENDSYSNGGCQYSDYTYQNELQICTAKESDRDNGEFDALYSICDSECTQNTCDILNCNDNNESTGPYCLTTQLNSTYFYSTLSDYCDEAQEILDTDCDAEDAAADSFCSEGSPSLTKTPDEIECNGG